MDFENKQNESIEKVGEYLGFLVGFFLFTTALFYILTFTNKIGSLTYYHIIGIATSILIVGTIFKNLLK